MTPTQIRELREELESALLQAFTDFKRLSGVDIHSVDLRHICYQYVGDPRPDRHLTHVTVQLEPI